MWVQFSRRIGNKGYLNCYSLSCYHIQPFDSLVNRHRFRANIQDGCRSIQSLRCRKLQVQGNICWMCSHYQESWRQWVAYELQFIDLQPYSKPLIVSREKVCWRLDSRTEKLLRISWQYCLTLRLYLLQLSLKSASEYTGIWLCFQAYSDHLIPQLC